MKKVGFVYHPIYSEHFTGDNHPERKSRLDAIIRQLKKDGLYSQLIPIQAYEAPVEYIKTIHDESYIAKVKSASLNNVEFLDTLDCPISEKTFEAALWATGGMLSAADHIIAGTIQRAFCAVRPPGHHAENDRAMGFCFFNSIAITAKYLQQKYNIKKIFIIDWDVHHGNGTQHSFERDSSVFYCSIHEDPRLCYPGTGYVEEIGLDNGKGYTLNCPVSIGSGDSDYIKIFETQIIPAIKQFKPNFILISAGFDAHKDDPLAQVNLTEKAFVKLTQLLNSASDEFCDGRIISLLEGGYNLIALGNSVSQHIKALIGD